MGHFSTIGLPGHWFQGTDVHTGPDDHMGTDVRERQFMHNPHHYNYCL